MPTIGFWVTLKSKPIATARTALGMCEGQEKENHVCGKAFLYPLTMPLQLFTHERIAI
jgi:hypothetical protein